MLSIHFRTLGLLGVCFAATVMLAACMPDSRAGNVYSSDQARVSHSVYYGTILRVSDVTIEGEYTPSMKFTVALDPVSDSQAFVMGVGRYRGDAVTVTGSGKRTKIRFQGYGLTKSKRK